MIRYFQDHMRGRQQNDGQHVRGDSGRTGQLTPRQGILGLPITEPHFLSVNYSPFWIRFFGFARHKRSGECCATNKIEEVEKVSIMKHKGSSPDAYTQLFTLNPLALSVFAERLTEAESQLR